MMAAALVDCDIWTGICSSCALVPPYVFYKKSVTSLQDFNLNFLVSSADGNLLFASSMSCEIVISVDGGVLWTKSSAPCSKWTSLASSADGTRLAAAAKNGGIYTSTDGGMTWVQTSAFVLDWCQILSSYDGTRLIASALTDSSLLIYTSIDSGITWVRVSSPFANIDSFNSRKPTIAASADCMKLVAVSGDRDGQIFTSTDGGVMWQSTSSSQEWRGIASSADGNKLFAISSDADYISLDAGVTWSKRTSFPTYNGDSLSSSADGTRLLRGHDIWTSIDSGLKWIDAGISSDCQSISADGTKITAFVKNEIWVGICTNCPTIVCAAGQYLSLQSSICVTCPISSSSSLGVYTCVCDSGMTSSGYGDNLACAQGPFLMQPNGVPTAIPTKMTFIWPWERPTYSPTLLISSPTNNPTSRLTRRTMYPTNPTTLRPSSDTSEQWTQDLSWVIPGHWTGFPKYQNGFLADPIKCFDGNLNTFWNPVGTLFGQFPYYFELDFGELRLFTSVRWSNIGDNVHDATQVKIECIENSEETDILFGFTLSSGFSDLQAFKLEKVSTPCQIVKISVLATEGGWQPMIREIAFKFTSSPLHALQSKRPSASPTASIVTHPAAGRHNDFTLTALIVATFFLLVYFVHRFCVRSARRSESATPVIELWSVVAPFAVASSLAGEQIVSMQAEYGKLESSDPDENSRE